MVRRITLLAIPVLEYKTLLTRALPVLLVLALAGVLFGLGFRAPAEPQDEGLLLTYPARIQAGNLPYRDFSYGYGPATIGTLAAVYGVIGPSIIAERMVGLVYRFAIILAVFALVQRWGRRQAAIAAILSGSLLSLAGPYASAWSGGLALVLWGLWCWDRSNFGLAAFLGGLALAFRPDLIVAVVAPAVILVVGAGWRRRLTYLLAALVIGCVPYLALAMRMGIWPLINNLIVTPIFYVGPARRLPLGPAGGLLVVLLLTTGALVVLGVREAQRGDRLLLMLGVLALCLLPQAFQRPDGAHWAIVACVTLAMLPVPLSKVPIRMRRVVTRSGTILAGLLFALALDGAWMNTGVNVVHAGRSFRLRAEQAPMVQALLDGIDRYAKPGDRVFIGPRDLQRTVVGDTFLYALLPRLTPASYFLEMNPGSANRADSRLASDVASADALILTSLYERPTDSTFVARAWWLHDSELAWQPGDERAQQVVAQRFCKQAEYDLYQILTRCH